MSDAGNGRTKRSPGNGDADKWDGDAYWMDPMAQLSVVDIDPIVNPSKGDPVRVSYQKVYTYRSSETKL